MAGNLNGGSGPGAQIRLNLLPTAQPGQYQVQVEHTGVDGGWSTVFAVLLGGLGLVVNQMTPGKNVGQSPVFAAMCGVFQAFMQGLVQAGEAPQVERVTRMPLPLGKEWFKN